MVNYASKRVPPYCIPRVCHIIVHDNLTECVLSVPSVLCVDACTCLYDVRACTCVYVRVHVCRLRRDQILEKYAATWRDYEAAYRLSPLAQRLAEVRRTREALRQRCEQRASHVVGLTAQLDRLQHPPGGATHPLHAQRPYARMSYDRSTLKLEMDKFVICSFR